MSTLSQLSTKVKEFNQERTVFPTNGAGTKGPNPGLTSKISVSLYCVRAPHAYSAQGGQKMTMSPLEQAF